MPIRVQRKRIKGWKMPEGAVYVGRPTRWGNPFAAGPDMTARTAVDRYRSMWLEYIEREPRALIRLRVRLGGKNLACWCALDRPCHADVLLKIANA
jgi:hypothetical protein